MRLPLKYNIASVTQRRMRSLLTILGVGTAIFLAVMMVALSRGLQAATLRTGEELNLLVLSKGAESMEFSALDPNIYSALKSSPDVAQGRDGALVSPELFINTTVTAPGHSAQGEVSLGLVRGVLPVGMEVHRQVQILEGSGPERGNKVIVGKLAATKLGLPAEAVAIGSQLSFEGQLWTVSGTFAAPGTAFESEIWAQLDDFMVASKRDDYSAIVMATSDAAQFENLKFDLDTRTDVRVTSEHETLYYAALAGQLKPVQYVSLIMTVILVAGGLLAGMNTMFNSIAGRVREMAVLLVLGYRRRAVLLSFVLESVVLCLAGGIVGSAAGLLLNGLPMKIPMGAFRFVVDAGTLGFGVGMALVIGVLGALMPVARVARLSTVEGLRAR